MSGNCSYWLAEGKVRPHISERVPLSGVADAMQRMIERKVIGKVIVLPRAGGHAA